MAKFAAADQAALREHFGLAAAPAVGGAAAAVPEGAPADDLPYMWSGFLTKNGVKDPKLAAIHATLGQSGSNKLYVKGLGEIHQFAQKAFGNLPGSRHGSDPTAAAACKKEAKKYAGTPWQEILNRMGDDAS